MLNYSAEAVKTHIAMIERCITETAITDPTEASCVRVAAAMATRIAGQHVHMGSIAGSGPDGSFRLLELFVPESDRAQFVTDDQYVRTVNKQIRPDDLLAFDNALTGTRSRVLGLILYQDRSPYVRESDLGYSPARNMVLQRGMGAHPAYLVYSGPDTPTTMIHFDAVAQIYGDPYLTGIDTVSGVLDTLGPDAVHTINDDKELQLILRAMSVANAVPPRELLSSLTV